MRSEVHLVHILTVTLNQRLLELLSVHHSRTKNPTKTNRINDLSLETSDHQVKTMPSRD